MCRPVRGGDEKQTTDVALSLAQAEKAIKDLKDAAQTFPPSTPRAAALVRIGVAEENLKAVSALLDAATLMADKGAS